MDIDGPQPKIVTRAAALETRHNLTILGPDVDTKIRVVAGEVVPQYRPGGAIEWTTGNAVLRRMYSVSRLAPLSFSLGDVYGSKDGVVGVYASGFYFHSEQLNWTGNGQEIELARSPSTTVLVLDQHRQPVQGARVVVRSALAEEWQTSVSIEGIQNRLYREEGTTDGDGVFALSSPIREEMAAFVLLADGTTGAVDWSFNAGEQAQLSLADSAQITVTVIDAEGAAVPRADVATFCGGFDEAGLVDSRRTEEPGIAVLRSGPTEVPSFVYVWHSDFTPQLQRVEMSESALNVSVTFRLVRATSLDVTLLDVNSDPIAGVAGRVMSSSGAWSPITHKTSGTGRFEPPLAASRSDSCIIQLSNGGLDLGELVVPPSDAEPAATICVDWLGRFSPLAGGAQLEESLDYLEILGPTGASGGVAGWEPTSASPWLRRGPSRLVAYWRDGLVSEHSVNVGPGDNQIPDLERSLGELSVSDAQGLFQGQLVEVLSSTGALVFEGEITNQPLRVTLCFGAYYLRVDDVPGANPRTGVPIRLDVEERTIELSDLFSTCTLSGAVLRGDGIPIAGIDVQLRRNDSWYCGLVRTDGAGQFGFVGLLPGRYQVEAFLDSACGPGAQVVKSVLVLGELTRADIVLGTQDTDSVEIVAVDAPGQMSVTGMATGNSWTSVVPFGLGDSRAVGIANGCEQVGVIGRSTEGLLIAMEPYEGLSRQEIDCSARRYTTVVVLDGTGKPAPGAVVLPVVNGRVLTSGLLTANQYGQVFISGMAGETVELRVHLPSGAVGVSSLSSAVRTGKVQIHRVQRTLAVSDLEGVPILGALVCDSSGVARESTGLGGVVVVLADAEGDLLVSHDGYWPAIAGAGIARVTLRRIRTAVDIEIPIEESIGRVEVTPLFEVPGLGRLVGTPAGGSPETETWRIGPLAEGEYEIVAFSDKGKELFSATGFIR